MSIGELYKIKKRLFFDQLFVIKKYYLKDFRFALADLCLSFLCLFFNPYRVSRKFLQKKGEEKVYVYGETPLQTLHKIVSELDLQKNDAFFELGSGRGKGCFWVCSFVGCKTVGIEWVPLFSFFSKGIAKLLFFKNLSFCTKNFHNTSFEKATALYLYSTSMEEKEIALLLKKFEKELPFKAKVVTISSPLPQNFSFKLKKMFPVQFIWGETTAYLHEKI